MITLTNTLVEDKLKEILQQDVKITINNKTLKTGKLLLFKQNNFYIELFIQTPKKLEKLDIPYPYGVELWEEDKILYFDYRLETLSKDVNIQKLLKEFSLVKTNKFYDKILEVSYEF